MTYVHQIYRVAALLTNSKIQVNEGLRKIFIKYDENVTPNCGWWPQTHWVQIIQKCY